MPLLVAFVAVGFGETIGQVLLIRELLVNFQGNELSLGIIFACWLLMIAFGSWGLGRFTEKLKPQPSTFVFTLILYAFILPSQLLLARVVNAIIGISPGEIAGLLHILYASLLVLTPLCLVHGFQFPLACHILAAQKGKPAAQVGRIYVAEALGCMAGGALLTYVLVHHFTHTEIAALTVLINLAAGIVLLRPLLSHQFLFSKVFILAVCITGVIFLNSKVLDELDFLSAQWQWQGHKLVHVQNSVYQNIAVTQKGEQLNFFGGGMLLFTHPVPDIRFVEEMSHFPLLHHPAPQKVLLIGGTVDIIQELRKHSVTEIYYTEPDPLIIRTAEDYLSVNLSQLPETKVEYTDGRLFIQRTEEKFDAVIMNLPSPSTLQLNRFYTREFFNEVRGILSSQGILAFSLPSSEAYVSEEMARLNNSIFKTLRTVFSAVAVIPGDFNIFLASPASGLLPQSTAEICRRFEQRGLDTKLFTSSYIRYKLSPQRVSGLTAHLGGEGELNSDSKPVATFYNLALWNAMFYPGLKGIFDTALKVKLWWFLPCLPLFLLPVLLNLRRKRFPVSSVALAVLTTGFAGISLSIVLLFAFQVTSGYLYQKIGILIGAFMLGLALGGYIMNRLLARVNRDIFVLSQIEIAIALYAFLLPYPVLVFTQPLLVPGEVLFSLLNLTTGFLVGLEFPLAGKVYLQRSNQVGQVAGFLSAADLWGSVVGALLTGVLFIPILGLVGTCWVASIFNLATFSLLLVAASVFPQVMEQ